ncbi:Toll-like receptor 3 [Candida viswanathii]|uniref:Toll-like receptor 3 n=1 Tax=Candida viswanathii TaxID=5486 RepID=A0A367XLF9_9ASCO|nr:Toll-like receptor 3 [Candida viswanathii]
MLFALPPELISTTLSNLSSDELQYYFDVLELVSSAEIHDSYLPIRKIALLCYYSHKPLIITNSVAKNQHHHHYPDGVELSVEELHLLRSKGIVIKPKQTNILINDDNCDCGCFNVSYIKFIEQLMDLLPYINTCCPKINLVLNLTTDKFYNFAILNNFFERIQFIEVLAIKYTGDKIINFQNLKIQKIQLQFFNLNKLLSHLQVNNIANTQHLELRYNLINNLYFIPLNSNLVSLNLSNNNLVCINDANFNWKILHNLESLDLSNNNIVELNLSGNSTSNYRLKRLNLFANSLRKVPNFNNCKLFRQLEEINLSRNSIATLPDNAFPPTLKSLWLKGNYLPDLMRSLSGRVFPKSLNYLDLTYCRILLTGHDDEQEAIRKLIEAEQLHKLKVLELEF